MVEGPIYQHTRMNLEEAEIWLRGAVGLSKFVLVLMGWAWPPTTQKKKASMKISESNGTHHFPMHLDYLGQSASCTVLSNA
jgi:hypothetical protein